MSNPTTPDYLGPEATDQDASDFDDAVERLIDTAE